MTARRLTANGHNQQSANSASPDHSAVPTAPLSPLSEPLAARMRPRTLDEFLGQDHLLGPGSPWAMHPPGRCGVLHLLGPARDRQDHPRPADRAAHRAGVRGVLSAVTEGVPRVREIIREAEQRRVLGQGTMLFCDEIHRFNRAQQDAFLPHVESGTITLIGATTENPSFELNGALLSRCQVFVLQPLTARRSPRLVERALTDHERGLGHLELEVSPGAIALLAEQSDGDARRALTVLEAAAQLVGPGGALTAGAPGDALAAGAGYDKSGEEHFNLLSAFHKSLRGSDPQAALYWMARMLEGGEDPLMLFRRAIAMAAEDVGLADPQALKLAVAARDAYHMLGPPEGYLPLAEMTVYLATAPKSNRAGGARRRRWRRRGRHRPSRCRCISGTRPPT